MNPVEIEEAVTKLAGELFDSAEFPFQFLIAFGNKKTTIDRLRKGNTNQSDVPGGVLQRNHIHIATCPRGEVVATLTALRDSPKTASNKVRFILATDGAEFQAEELTGAGETVACDYAAFPDHFGFFLPLAGITTVAQIRESSFDIRATGRLNKLYLTLLQDNPDWAAAERRSDMNHFMARLIFCFFAEDTDIFHPSYRFTATVEKMSAGGAENTHEVIAELFRAMNTPIARRQAEGIARWADPFPYVNGALFGGDVAVPRFSRIARSYLIHIGNLDWTKINPDIFGSMIQAVADDEERGALGMHYTSVPNILKVLNPLFLDDLRAKLEEAADNGRKLLNLRNRMARIRVFDPACGSGNFLVIAYKQMREIEAEINRRRGEPGRASDIPLTNFRGIELRDFPAEIARLALIIAEYQSDVLYRGQQEALAEFLPLDSENWITCGNALRLDWLSICPPTGTGVKVQGDDLFETPLDQSEIDFENAGGETYICGNPPYKGRNKKGGPEKEETENVFSSYAGSFASLDYVSNWLVKAATYSRHTDTDVAFVTTNSVCQGEQVALLWPVLFSEGCHIHFAHTSFKWSNLASDKAGVTVVIIGLSRRTSGERRLFSGEEVRSVGTIGPYLVPETTTIVQKATTPSQVSPMYLGNMAKDGGHLLMDLEDGRRLVMEGGVPQKFVRKFYGSDELINARPRACVWVSDQEYEAARSVPAMKGIFERVKQFRDASNAPSTRKFSATPHRFVQLSAQSGKRAIVIPRVRTH